MLSTAQETLETVQFVKQVSSRGGGAAAKKVVSAAKDLADARKAVRSAKTPTAKAAVKKAVSRAETSVAQAKTSVVNVTTNVNIGGSGNEQKTDEQIAYGKADYNAKTKAIARNDKVRAEMDAYAKGADKRVAAYDERVKAKKAKAVKKEAKKEVATSDGYTPPKVGYAAPPTSTCRFLYSLNEGVAESHGCD